MSTPKTILKYPSASFNERSSLPPLSQLNTHHHSQTPTHNADNNYGLIEQTIRKTTSLHKDACVKLKEISLFNCLNCDNNNSSFSDSNYFFKTAGSASTAAVTSRSPPARPVSGEAPNDKSAYATIDSLMIMNAAAAASTQLVSTIDTSTTSSVSFLSATSTSVDSNNISLSPVSQVDTMPRSAFSFTNSSHTVMSQVYETNRCVVKQSLSPAATPELKRTLFRDINQGLNSNVEFKSEQIQPVSIFLYILSEYFIKFNKIVNFIS